MTELFSFTGRSPSGQAEAHAARAMLFTTPTFLIFLAIVWPLYWSFSRVGQNRLILVASLVFYGWWDWRFLLMLLFVAGVDFSIARRLETAAHAGARRALLGLSLGSNLGALCYFKYFNFFAATFVDFSHTLGFQVSPVTVRVILPVGISFYTFQALSYTIDVYRGQLAAVDSVVEYFCFITFFPHMVAGPIQQARHLLVQFARERHFDVERTSDGARQMLWGLFKKMVIADNLATYVDAMYRAPGNVSGWELLYATYFFAFQIYCDFSGYTDIAIGCARIFGLHMTRNFAYPYFAQSIHDFWRRWHISLSTWFREYVYIPLGGNRVARWRQNLNVLIVFAVSGLWHGANWTFLVWGLLHGLFYLLESMVPGFKERSDSRGRGLVSMALTFNLVTLAWVFFRADSVYQAVVILHGIGTGLVDGTAFVAPPWRLLVGIVSLLGIESLLRHEPHGLQVAGLKPALRWACYYAAFASILLFAQLKSAPFIYFQF